MAKVRDSGQGIFMIFSKQIDDELTLSILPDYTCSRELRFLGLWAQNQIKVSDTH